MPSHAAAHCSSLATVSGHVIYCRFAGECSAQGWCQTLTRALAAAAQPGGNSLRFQSASYVPRFTLAGSTSGRLLPSQWQDGERMGLWDSHPATRRKQPAPCCPKPLRWCEPWKPNILKLLVQRQVALHLPCFPPFLQKTRPFPHRPPVQHLLEGFLAASGDALLAQPCSSCLRCELLFLAPVLAGCPSKTMW